MEEGGGVFCFVDGEVEVLDGVLVFEESLL